jgi:hypothetical protein
LLEHSEEWRLRVQGASLPWMIRKIMINQSEETGGNLMKIRWRRIKGRKNCGFKLKSKETLMAKYWKP